MTRKFKVVADDHRQDFEESITELINAGWIIENTFFVENERHFTYCAYMVFSPIATVKVVVAQSMEKEGIWQSVFFSSSSFIFLW